MFRFEKFIKELLGITQNNNEIEDALRAAEEDKRKKIILEQINLYSRNLHNETQLTFENAFAVFIKKAKDSIKSNEDKSTIAAINLKLPENTVKKFTKSLKNTILAYQVYSKSEKAVNVGLTVGIAAGSTAIGSATFPVIGAAVYGAGNAVKKEVSEFLRYSASLITLNIMQAIQGQKDLIYDEETINQFWQGLSSEQKNLIKLLAEEQFRYLFALDKEYLNEEKRNNYQKLLIQSTVLLSNSLAHDIEQALDNQQNKNTINKFTEMLSSVFNRNKRISSYELQSKIFSAFAKNCDVALDQADLTDITFKQIVREDRDRWTQLKTLANTERSKVADIEQYNQSTKLFTNSIENFSNKVFIGTDLSYLLEYKIYVGIHLGEDNNEQNKILKENIIKLYRLSKQQITDLVENPNNINNFIENTINFIGDRNDANLSEIHEEISTRSTQNHLAFLEYKRKVRAEILSLAYTLNAIYDNPPQPILDKLKDFYVNHLQGNNFDFDYAIKVQLLVDINKTSLAEKLIDAKIKEQKKLLFGQAEFWLMQLNRESPAISNLVSHINETNANLKIEADKNNKPSQEDINELISNTKNFLKSLENEPELYQIYLSVLKQQVAALCLDTSTDPLLVNSLNQFRQETLGVPKEYLDDLYYLPTVKPIDEDNPIENHLSKLDFFIRATTNLSGEETYKLKFSLPDLKEEQSIPDRLSDLDNNAAKNSSHKAFVALKRLMPKNLSHERIGQLLDKAKGIIDVNAPSLNTVDFTDQKSILGGMFSTAGNTIASYSAMRLGQYAIEAGLNNAANKAGNIALIPGANAAAEAVMNAVAKPIANFAGFVGGMITFKILQKINNRKENIDYDSPQVEKDWQNLPPKVQNQLSNIVDIYCRYLALLDKKSSVSDDEIINIRLQLGNAIIVLSNLTVEEREAQADKLKDQRSFGARTKASVKNWLGLLPSDDKFTPEDLQAAMYQVLGELAGNAATLIKNNPWAKFWHNRGEGLRKRGFAKMVDAIATVYDNFPLVKIFSALQIERLSSDKRKLLNEECVAWENNSKDAKLYRLTQPKPEEYLTHLKFFRQSLNEKGIGNSPEKMASYKQSLKIAVTQALSEIDNDDFKQYHPKSYQSYNNHLENILKLIESESNQSDKKIIQMIDKEISKINSTSNNLKFKKGDNQDKIAAIKKAMGEIVNISEKKAIEIQYRGKILLGAESPYYIAYMEHSIPNNASLKKLKKESTILIEQAREQFKEILESKNPFIISQYIHDTEKYLAYVNNNAEMKKTTEYMEYINRVRVQVLQLIHEFSQKNKSNLALEAFYINSLSGDKKDIDFSKMTNAAAKEDLNHLAKFLLQKKNNGSLVMLGSKEIWELYYNGELPQNFNADQFKMDEINIGKALSDTKEFLEIQQKNKKRPNLFCVYRDLIAKQIAEISRDRSLDNADVQLLNQFWQEDLKLPLNYKDDLDLLLYVSQNNLKYTSLYLRAVTIEPERVKANRISSGSQSKIYLGLGLNLYPEQNGNSHDQKMKEEDEVHKSREIQEPNPGQTVVQEKSPPKPNGNGY